MKISKLIILTPIILSLCYVGIWFYPSVTLRINQSLWGSNMPLEYQMQVAEMRPDGGPWRWMIRVKNGKVISTELIEADTHGKSDNKSWLEPASLTVEYLFTFAKQHCVNRGFLDCDLELHPQYHFPTLIYSYELIIVQVESFVDCTKDFASCGDT